VSIHTHSPSNPPLPWRSRGQHLLISLALVAVVTARDARAQSAPPTPVWEATGYGAVHGFHQSGYQLHELIVRPADAGGPAEFTMFPGNGEQSRAERWQVSEQGVPFLAGYVPMRGHPQTALWMDMDGDGASDLVCLEQDGSGWFAEVLLMQSGSPRTPGRRLDLPYIGAVNAMLEDDINGDGRKDVGVVGTDHSIWLLGTGSDSLALGPEVLQWDRSPAPDSTLSGPSPLQGYSSSVRYVAGRLDSDPIPDLIWWDPASKWLWFGQGMDGGAFAFRSLSWPTPPGTGTPVFADLDLDGQPDFISGSYLYRGEPSGAPTLLDSLSDQVVALEDVDHDGHLDLVALAAGSVRVAHGRGGFEFESFTATPAGAIAPMLIDSHLNDRPADVTGLSAVADLNGDGWVDVVSAGPLSGELDVIPGHVGGGFFSPLRLQTAADPVQIELADVLGADGRLDIITLDRGARELEVRAGGGDGSFGPARAVALPAGAIRFALGDLDSDGWLDAVVACDSARTLSILRGGPSGFGSGLDLVASDALTELQIADVDEDGKLDICASAAAGTLVCWRGGGDMTFTPAAWSSGQRGDGRLRLTDFDGDGHLDLVTEDPDGAWSSWEFLLERGDGQGDFNAYTAGRPYGSVNYGPYFGARSAFTVADLAGDGRMSLAIAGTDSTDGTAVCELTAYTPDSSGYVRPLPDRPDGGFGTYALAPRTTQIAVADVTGDGIPDVIALSEMYCSLTVLPGIGGLRFGTPISHTVGSAPSSFALGDVDGDGLPDAVVADAGSNDVVVLRHRGAQLTGVSPRLAPSRLSLRVASAPASARVRVRLSLVGSAAARLEAFDVTGRRLGRQRIEGLAGTREIDLEPRLTPRSGLVFLRLTQGAESATARAIHVR
jgi:hypothetical protein